MKLIVGLGNPGREYERTPHNVGFEVIDRLAAKSGGTLRRSLRFKALVSKTDVAGQPAWLVKPLSFMNLSGGVVAAILRTRGLATDALIVVLDDADLPAGRLRIRPRGGAGGHKGLQSIIEQAGDDRFARVRIGIGRRDRTGPSLAEQVLSPWSAGEWTTMQSVLDRAAEAVGAAVERGVDAAMNVYNATKTEGEEDRP